MRFLGYALATGTVFLGKIEADSKEEALKKAEELAAQKSISLCHQCSENVDMDSDLSRISVEEL